MSSYEELINELSELCGIIPEYWDIFGNRHTVSIETQKAILRVMRLNIDSEENIQEEIAELKVRPWNGLIEPVKVVSANDQSLTIPIYIPIEEGRENELSILWSVWNETGQKDEFISEGSSITVSDQRWINGRRYIRIDLKERGGRDIGYYTVSVLCKTPDIEIAGSSRIIITPDSCYIPSELEHPSPTPLPQGEGARGRVPELEHGKTWGLSTNLYSIRSDRNWGMGDFTDLKNIVKWTAGLKGGFVGINPLHAIPNKKPFGMSPYSPISRFYKNFIYLDIESILEVKELLHPPSPPLSKGGMGGYCTNQTIEIENQIDELRNCDLIDYEKVAAIKEKLLRHAFEVFYETFSNPPIPPLVKGGKGGFYLNSENRIEEFKRYITEEGENLEYFSTYMALSKELGEGWHEWPEEYRSPYSNAVKEFKNTYKKELMFQAYIQWLIDGQFREISEHAKNLGMSIGIYHDLAIGSIGGGSDAWTAQDIIADRTDLGAPPDDFNPNGQNWGFPPLIPEKLKDSGYEYFIQTIRKNMKHCGALRIDHALGMFRQFWIPQGMPASRGAYVRLPSEDLLRIIALESVRNKTMVVAEDLGTVGENARERLLSFGMLSYRLLYFERNYPDPSFTTPERYPETALCAVTTHDLPTIYGWWSGRDIDLKKRLGIYPDETTYQMDISNRERDKRLLLEALISHGIIGNPPTPLLEKGGEGGFEMTPELCLAVYAYLARTPCKLLAVSLDDAIGAPDQQNMPGITNSYPSWMQKTPIPLEQMLSDKWFSDLSEMFKKNNR